MWGSNKKHAEKVDTLLGQKTQIRGDIVFSGGLHIDGKVEGNIIAESNESTVLVISETGFIAGEVRVPYIVINGTVVGDVHALECVELASHARVEGNVFYNKIEMAMGAEVNGNLVHLDEEKNPLLLGSGQPEPASVQATET